MKTRNSPQLNELKKPDKPDNPDKSDRLHGFTYSISQEQIDEYRAWSMERRLKWLFFANKMRKFLPEKTIELQESFRKGKI